jgi:hypothetical protein
VNFSSAPSLSIMGSIELETPDAARGVLEALRDDKVGHGPAVLHSRARCLEWSSA